MDGQTSSHSPEFRQFLQQVETALYKAAADARRLAEQTGTKLIVYERPEQGQGDYTAGREALPADAALEDFKAYVKQSRKRDAE